MSKESEFYKKLKYRLDETTSFPTNYMYKFIIPTNKENFIKIENIFNNMGAVINSKASKTDKFTSITILVDMDSSDKIIEKYRDVAKVEGVISL